MTDSVALKGVIKRSGLKYGKIAECIGISAYTLQKKIDNVTEFKASEIAKLASLLSLSKSEVNNIFFATQGD